MGNPDGTIKRKKRKGFNLKVENNLAEVDSIESNLEGNYVFSADAVASLVEKLHSCCPKSGVSVREVASERSGHDSAIQFNCSSCDLSFYLNDPDRHKTSFRESKKINTTFAFGATVTGLDFVTLKKLCAILGIDGPPDSFDQVYINEIHSKLTSEIEKKLTENRLISFTSRNSDPSKPTKIFVKADGTYQKRGDRSRGYTSKFGIAVLFDADTNLPIDFHVHSKFFFWRGGLGGCTSSFSKFNFVTFKRSSFFQVF